MQRHLFVNSLVKTVACQQQQQQRSFSLTSSRLCNTSYHRPVYRGLVRNRRSGVFKPTERNDLPLTYEQAGRPEHIGNKKAWTTWNTSSLWLAPRQRETAMEDLFIRKFINGTWYQLFVSQVVIKRNHNLIRIVGIVSRSHPPSKYYFLTGYTERILSYILKCPVQMELQTAEQADMVFRYV